MKPFIVADDFGLCEKHDKIIIELAKKKKVNAISVLVHDELSGKRVNEVRKMRDYLSVGLHLNLTMVLPKIQPIGSIKTLIIKSLLGSLNTREIKKEILSQIREFEKVFGTLPDFIDGHEHVHILPSILEILSKIVVEEKFSEKFWIRSPVTETMADLYRELSNAGLKVLIITALGSRAKNKLNRLGILTNKNFAGFFSLKSPSRNFKQKYLHLLTLKKPDMVIMVHPGTSESPTQNKNHSNEIRAIEATMLNESGIYLT